MEPYSSATVETGLASMVKQVILQVKWSHVLWARQSSVWVLLQGEGAATWWHILFSFLENPASVKGSSVGLQSLQCNVLVFIYLLVCILHGRALQQGKHTDTIHEFAVATHSYCKTTKETNKRGKIVMQLSQHQNAHKTWHPKAKKCSRTGKHGHPKTI